MQGILIFSEHLRLEAISYFEKRFKEPVTHEQADLYLGQLAELVAAFEAIEAGKRATALRAVPAAPPDLIYPHSC